MIVVTNDKSMYPKIASTYTLYYARRDPRWKSISELFQTEKATAVILAFLKATGVGKMPGERDWKDGPKAVIDRRIMIRRTMQSSRELFLL